MVRLTPVLLVLWALRGAQDASEQASGVTFTRPKGWERKENPQNKAVTLVPSGAPEGRLCSVTFVPGQPFPGAAAAWHDALWKSMTHGTTAKDSPTEGTHGLFKRTMAQVARADGATLWLCLYTVVKNGRGEAILYASDVEDVFRSNLETVHAMVDQATVGAAPAAPAPTKLLDLEGAYWGLKLNGESRFLWMFKNGLATREWQVGGFDGLDVEKAAAGDKNWNCGRWTREGDTYTVNYATDSKTVTRRYVIRDKEKGLLASSEAPFFWAVSSPDDVTFDATFERDAQALHLRKDGTFSEDGVVGACALGSDPKPPGRGGSGKYRFRNFTLHLHYDGGPHVRVGIFVKAEEVKAPRTLYVNTYLLERKK